ncbi:hypothetical protein HELRODRAFT_182937 [Helobdella robusta]|uniref:Acireductone dioxygenase n=1 Tax=Helobdella robusta TaxID=6412 RepID=T1FIY0_HELRO|nr:hypothetical protein HELRODRAFT_182937 [Helobdella robusta]ESN90031.1 hypothetical protein HELRODRAFT_182937 [Helobdella robusta]
MVQAWYHDNKEGDQKKPHQPDRPEFVTLEKLLTFGVHYWKIESQDQLDKLAVERGYNYNDEVTCNREKLPNYDVMMKKFFEEHVHTDDETRFVINGSGYFDVRDPTNDTWIRVYVETGDMISVPPGLYHRFTTDENDYAHLRRFFQASPDWTAYNRADGLHPSTVQYLKTYGKGK